VAIKDIKFKIDREKSVEAINGIVQSTVDFGKKTAAGAKNNVLAIMEKSKQDAYLRKMKKYNPLFPEQYYSDSFNLPNMIMIVDDAERRDIDVCEGAIGWLKTENNIEVLYLYDEFAPNSGLHFIPSITCDAIYYVDNFDRNKFIRTDCIFAKAHEERLAELKYIAYSLGARRCSIEISESTSDTQKQNKSYFATEGYYGLSGKESAEQDLSISGNMQRSGRSIIEFEGNNSPVKPELKWFAHDDNINRLIEMRCKGNNSIKTETLELSGSSSAAMSQKTAYAIDTAIGKMGEAKGGLSMNSQAAKEHHSKLLFWIEF